MVELSGIPQRPVVWPKTFRIIRSVYPPIDLFEDIADPADWEALASAEAKTNPRLRADMGQLDLVPPHRRVGGPGASPLMAPFVHVSKDRPGRFTDGSYGVYSAARDEETALREVAYHHARTLSATRQAPGWTSQFRVLIGQIDATLHDVGTVAGVLHPDDYSVGQETARALRAGGSNGVVYPSVRHVGGTCIGIFWPDVLPIPVQGSHYEFHFDGTRVDRIRDCTNGRLYGL